MQSLRNPLIDEKIKSRIVERLIVSLGILIKETCLIFSDAWQTFMEDKLSENIQVCKPLLSIALRANLLI